MKRLIVDMDGVIADVYSQYIAYEEKETGIRQPMSALMGKKEFEGIRKARFYIEQKGFFRNAPMIEGSLPVMKELNKKYELFIVSAAMEFPNSLPEKLEWLGEHLPFITWQQIAFCGSKALIKGDIMIDDHFKNLDYFTGETILFSQPHNFGMDTKHHKRAENWEEVASMLL